MRTVQLNVYCSVSYYEVITKCKPIKTTKFEMHKEHIYRPTNKDHRQAGECNH